VSEEKVKKYQPSSGTEGDMFIETFCDRCEHDREYRETESNPCEILNNTLVFDVGDEQYPEEWTYDKGGHPICTKFLLEGTPIIPEGSVELPFEPEEK